METQRPNTSATPPPPPPEFSDLLMRQKYQEKLAQQQKLLNQQHIQQHLQQQQITAAMRLGVNEQQLNTYRMSGKAFEQQPQQTPSQQYDQQFLTLTRNKAMPVMQSSQQQFATLTRQQQLSLQQRHNYSDYIKLTVQNRLMRRTSSSPQPTQQQSHQPLFTRKAVIEWTSDDVQEWLKCIGMAEHKSKFEFFNGAKLMRLDNNALLGVGIRQQQHRIYLLDKLKQQIWQNHQ